MTSTRPPTPGTGKALLSGGFVLLLLGFGSYAASSFFDGGFFRGLFQGATVVLMIGAAYFFGYALRRRGGPRPDDMWRPSDDDPERSRP